MCAAKTKQSIAAANVISMTALAPQCSAPNTKSMTQAVGFGPVIHHPRDMDVWASEGDHRLPTGQSGKKSGGQSQRGWFWTTFVGKGRASTQTIFASLRLSKTIILGKSCGRCSHGAEFPTHRQNTTFEEAYRQPDLFVAPPKPPKQEDMGL